MFTRQPSALPNFASVPKSVDRAVDSIRQPLAGGETYTSAAPAAQSSAAMAPERRGPPVGSTLSIIGSDLTIIGQGLRIVTRGSLQVDGRVDGDVAGHEVIIGETGRVTGVVSGQSVVVRGEVSGTVKGLRVELKSGAKVDGEVHHQQLTVEQGAQLDGRVHRPKDVSELTPVLD